MTKEETIFNFWSSFGIPAYDENTVPDEPVFPYITYEYVEGEWNEVVSMSASIWYRSTSWIGADSKLLQIEAELNHGGISLPFTGGAIWLTSGSPFAQRMSEESDKMIRRIYLNVNASFIE